MAKRDDIKKQIKKQQDEVYGESTVSGSAPDPASDDDVVENLKDAVGADINPGDEFHLADEVLKDENARRPAHKTEEVVEEDEDDNIIK
ncbi:hypothetical protein ACFL2C_02585 [Patescibacteria group bacterium]